jgi:hypothetical protein
VSHRQRPGASSIIWLGVLLMIGNSVMWSSTRLRVLESYLATELTTLPPVHKFG